MLSPKAFQGRLVGQLIYINFLMLSPKAFQGASWSKKCLILIVQLSEIFLFLSYIWAFSDSCCFTFYFYNAHIFLKKGIKKKKDLYHQIKASSQKNFKDAALVIPDLKKCLMLIFQPSKAFLLMLCTWKFPNFYF